MLFSENLVVFNVFYVNLGCLSIGWRLIYRLIYRLILNMQNLSAKSFFLLALSFFSHFIHHIPHVFSFLIFNRLIMRWLPLLCSVIDGRNVYKIHHAIHHLLPLSITSFSLSSCWKCFFYARDSGQRWKFSGQSLHLALKFCIFAECWQHRFHNGNNHCET